MGARFRPSQYANSKVLSTGEEIPFTLKRYHRPGPGILDELMLRDEFDRLQAAAEEASKQVGEVAKDVVGEGKPVSEKPITYIALGIFLVGAILSARNRPVNRPGSADEPDLLAPPPVES